MDGNGVIDEDELMSILTRATGATAPLTIQDAREIIAEFDRDDNGTLDLMEVEE